MLWAPSAYILFFCPWVAIFVPHIYLPSLTQGKMGSKGGSVLVSFVFLYHHSSGVSELIVMKLYRQLQLIRKGMSGIMVWDARSPKACTVPGPPHGHMNPVPICGVTGIQKKKQKKKNSETHLHFDYKQTRKISNLVK